MYFAVHPDVEEDGSNLSQVIMKMWYLSKDPLCPKTAILGSRIIVLTKNHYGNTAGSILKRGRLDALVDAMKSKIVSGERFASNENLFPSTAMPSQPDVHR